MLTVFAVWWGTKYDVRYPVRLRSAIGRHLHEEARFVLVTDNESVEGWECVPPICDYTGWWQKLSLFRIAPPGERCLYLDLDSVVIGDLGPVAHAPGWLCMPRNWAQSGHDSCQSSVMSWYGGAWQVVWDRFDFKRDSPNFWGDQEWMTYLLGKPGETGSVVCPIEHPLVVSYKYHCQDGPPDGASVVSCHGDPKPAAITDPWVREAWR